MCELLVRVLDHDNGVSLAGDVIAVCADGWEWARAEREAPHWRIVRLPGVDQVAFRPMMEVRLHGKGVAAKRALYFEKLPTTLDEALSFTRSRRVTGVIG